MKFLYLLALVVMLSVSVSAWPYELYSNGTLVDLNSSNNQSVNLTIYQITQVTNVTNVTNNITEFYNVTNITINDTAYTKNESDARFQRSGSQYGNTELYNRAELNIKLDNLSSIDANLTAQLDKLDETPTGWIWFGICVAILMAGIALVLVSKGESY